jgi:hypothetical protein
MVTAAEAIDTAIQKYAVQGVNEIVAVQGGTRDVWSDTSASEPWIHLGVERAEKED